MATSINAYGDGRKWDETQKQRTNDLLNQLRDALDVNDLERLRKDTAYLFDVLFPSGFFYTSNKGPSEPIHGGMMVGNAA